MRKHLAILAVAIAGVIPIAATGAPATAGAQPTATASCVNAHTPGGTKCLQAGEYCSHKPGYRRAYRRAGYRCNREGRLESL
jgi:hypothetical protein